MTVAERAQTVKMWVTRWVGIRQAAGRRRVNYTASIYLYRYIHLFIDLEAWKRCLVAVVVSCSPFIERSSLRAPLLAALFSCRLVVSIFLRRLRVCLVGVYFHLAVDSLTETLVYIFGCAYLHYYLNSLKTSAAQIVLFICHTKYAAH